MATGDRELLETAYPYLKETGNYITRNISSNTGLVTMLAGGDGSPNSYQYGIVDWPADGRFVRLERYKGRRENHGKYAFGKRVFRNCENSGNIG